MSGGETRVQGEGGECYAGTPEEMEEEGFKKGAEEWR